MLRASRASALQPSAEAKAEAAAKAKLTRALKSRSEPTDGTERPAA